MKGSVDIQFSNEKLLGISSTFLKEVCKTTLVGITFVSILTSCASHNSSSVSQENRFTSQSKVILTDDLACSELEKVMTASGRSWPVAQVGFNSDQASILTEGFERIESSSQDDLKKILQVWLKGFETLVPYLIADDREGAEKALNDTQQEALILAGTNLATKCSW